MGTTVYLNILYEDTESLSFKPVAATGYNTVLHNIKHWNSYHDVISTENILGKVTHSLQILAEH